MGFSVHEGAEVFARRRDAWLRLLARHEEESFFLRPEWLETAARHATSGTRFFLVLHEERGELTAGLPLEVASGRIGRWRLRKLEVAASPWLDRVEVPRTSDAAGADFLRELLAWADAELRGWTVLDLREATRDGFTATALDSIAGERRRERRVCSRAPCFDVRGGTRPGSANLRSQLARGSKRLAEHGKVEIAFERLAPAEVARVLDECARIERESWKGRTAQGIFSSRARADFFCDLFATFAASGAVALGSLRVGGELHAYHLGFLHARRFLSYNLAQREELAAHGPGAVLLQGMIERAAALGVDVLDASRGSLERPHLLARYGGPVREHEQLLVWRRSLRGAAIRFARSHVLPRLKGLRRERAAGSS